MPDTRNSFIVASATADAAKRNAADYLCDGTADDVQIQQAIDALPDAGGEILLVGDFAIESMIEYRSGVVLRGLGCTITVDDDIDDNAITRDGLPCVAAIGPSNPTSLRSPSVAVTDQSQNVAVEQSGAANLIHNAGDEDIYVFDGDQTATVGNDKTDAQLKAIGGSRQLSPGASITLPPSVTSYTVVCADSESSSLYTYAHVGVRIENIDIDYSGTKQDTCWHAGIWLDNCADSHVRDCNIDDVARPTGTTYRQFCGLITDSHSCSASGGRWTRAGYESIGLRGNNLYCEARDIYTAESVVHAAQTASMHYGDVTGVYGAAAYSGFLRIKSGQVEKYAYRGGAQAGGDIILHGEISADPRGLYVIDCRCSKVLVADKGRDIRIAGNHVTHEIKVYGIDSKSGIALLDIEIGHNTFDEPTSNGHWLVVETGSNTSGRIGGLRIHHNKARNGDRFNGNTYFYIESGSSVDIEEIRYHDNDVLCNEYAVYMRAYATSSGSVGQVFVESNTIEIDGGTGAKGGIRLHLDGSGDIIRCVNRGNVWKSADMQRGHNVVTGGTGKVHLLEITGNYYEGGDQLIHLNTGGKIDRIDVGRNQYGGSAITAIFEGTADAGTVARYFDNTGTTPTAVDSASLGANLTSGETQVA